MEKEIKRDYYLEQQKTDEKSILEHTLLEMFFKRSRVYIYNIPNECYIIDIEKTLLIVG